MVAQRALNRLSLALLLFYCCAGCETHLSHNVKASGLATVERTNFLPSTVAEASCPRASIEGLRFLIARAGKSYIELTCNTETLKDEFCQHFGDSLPYGFGVQLPASQEAWLSARSNEKIGASFCCYDALHKKVAIAKLVAFANYAEGGEGDIGFVGILDMPAEDSGTASDDLFGEKIIGVACPASSPCGLRTKSVIRPNLKLIEAIQDVLRVQLHDHTCSVLEAVQNAKDDAILAVAEHNRIQYVGEMGAKNTVQWNPQHGRAKSLFYLSPRNGGVTLVPFSGIEYSIEIKPEGGFPLDIYPGLATGTRVEFLPDVDHDGRAELFISASEGFIYSIVIPDTKATGAQEPFMKLVRNFHYGMRE